MQVERLSYYEPDDVPLPPIVPALIFCVPPLLWLGASCLILFRFVELNKAGSWVLMIPVILLPVPVCGFAAFAKYRYERRTWYVVLCLTINGLGILLSCTPLLLVWAWAMLALLAK
jgi:hypothetical protein